MRHTPEKLDQIIEAVKLHNSPLPWITNIDDLNRIYREAKAVLNQPDSYHLAVLQAAIDIAEEGKG